MSSYPSPLDISNDTAHQLIKNGGTILLLDVPILTQIGLDYLTFTTAEKFRGIKMIPPGPHYLNSTPAPSNKQNKHESTTLIQTLDNPITNSETFSLSSTSSSSSTSFSSSSPSSSISPRVGNFIWLNSGDVIVLRWNPYSESLCWLDDKDEEERYRLGVKNMGFDSGLGPYQFNKWEIWRKLSYHINQKVIHILDPPNSSFSPINSKYHLNDKFFSDTISNETDKKKEDIKVTQPSTVLISYTPIPSVIIPTKASPSLITQLHMDKTNVLHDYLTKIIGRYDLISTSFVSAYSYLLAEHSHSFLTFLVGESLTGFEQWKSMIILLSNCEKAIEDDMELYLEWLDVLQRELLEVPPDFFQDPISHDNFLQSAIKEFLVIVDDSTVPLTFLDKVKKLKLLLKKRFGWDFEVNQNLIEDEDDEFAPVIVQTNE